MLKEPGSRRIIAGIGLIVGTIAAFIVLFSVLYGSTEWWALIILLPVFAAMRKFSAMIRATDSPSGADQAQNDQAPGTDKRLDE